MDKTLIFLLIFSLLLVTWQAPFAMLTLMGIVALSVVFVRITWGLLQGFNQPAPEAQRVPTD
ncbi:hypothetical protein C7271_19540 [filamentous cyanobacterium CCP5]|nr:hypothetical protein C7271_19540 [filamentous cyanobacterium CCP5]